MTYVVNCSFVHNQTLDAESLKNLSDGIIGFVISCFFGFVGIINNVLLLYIFYHLKWFREPKMILFWNLAIVDLLVCLCSAIIYSWFLLKIIYHQSDVQQMKICVDTFFLLYGLSNNSNTFALAIAIDRLMSKSFPFHWSYKFGKTFRCLSVIISWILMVISQSGILLTAPTDNCVLTCLCCLPLPLTNWWYNILIIFCFIINFLVIIIYIILPTITALRVMSCVNQVERQGGGIILNLNRMKKYQKDFIFRLRLISGFIVGCFLVSMGPASVLCDVILPFFADSNLMVILASSVSSVCLVLNSFLPFYIWLFNPNFRQYFCSLFSKSVRRMPSNHNLYCDT